MTSLLQLETNTLPPSGPALSRHGKESVPGGDNAEPGSVGRLLASDIDHAQ